MKDFAGIPFAALPDINSPDFVSRLRNMLGTIDAFNRDASVAFARLSRGEVPTGSGAAVFGGGGRGATPSSASGSNNVVHANAPGANIMEWYDFGGSLTAYVDSTGVFHSQIFRAEAPLGTTRALIVGTGAINGSFLNIGDFTVPTVVASIDASGNIICNDLQVSGDFACGGDVDIAGGGIPIGPEGFEDFFALVDTGTGDVGRLAWSGIADLGTNGGGEIKLPRSSATVVTVGNQASATDILGKIALTAQTGSLGAQTLLTGSANTAGLYRVSFYVKTTTAGDALDNLTATLAWNDGSAQTEVVGFLGTTSSVVPFTAHDLATLNAFSHASIVVRVAASQNITFTTTLTSPGGGTPAYTCDARLESLG